MQWIRQMMAGSARRMLRRTEMLLPLFCAPLQTGIKNMPLQGGKANVWLMAQTWLSAISLLLISTTAGAECPPRYSVSVVQGLPCGFPFDNASVHGRGGNSAGVVCGDFACGGGQPRAFLATDGQTLSPIQFPAGTSSSRAVAMNDAGLTIGGYYNDNMPTFGQLGFVLNQGALTTILPLVGGTNVDPMAINSSNVVVGAWGHTGTGPYPLAFRWNNGAMQDLSAQLDGPQSQASGISDNGLITGWMGNAPWSAEAHAFIWDNGKVTDLGTPLPGCLATEGHAINSKGQVCGIWYRVADTELGWTRRGFFYDGKTMIDLGTLPFAVSFVAMDMNESGQIVGSSSSDPAGGGPGCLWQDGQLYYLGSLAVPLSNTTHIDSVYAISDNGIIYGSGRVWPSSQSVAVRLTPLPPKAADTNCDYKVNVDDLLNVINHWGVCAKGQSCDPDLNRDGFVNALDLYMVLTNWD